MTLVRTRYETGTGTRYTGTRLLEGVPGVPPVEAKRGEATPPHVLEGNPGSGDASGVTPTDGNTHGIGSSRHTPSGRAFAPSMAPHTVRHSVDALRGNVVTLERDASLPKATKGADASSKNALRSLVTGARPVRFAAVPRSWRDSGAIQKPQGLLTHRAAVEWQRPRRGCNSLFDDFDGAPSPGRPSSEAPELQKAPASPAGKSCSTARRPAPHPGSLAACAALTRSPPPAGFLRERLGGGSSAFHATLPHECASESER
jgi:hypothetical protein